MDFDVLLRSWPMLLQGFWFTLQITAVSATGGLVLGTLLAMARLSKYAWLSRTIGAYVNAVRSIPLLLVIFWFYFLVPFLGAWVIGSSRPIEINPLTSCIVTFIMFEACYFCEIMRAGIQSIPPGQAAAGRALGMGYWTMMSYVILPQALRNMLPILLSQTIVLFQDISLVSVLSLKDFFGAADFVAKRDGRPHEMYLAVAAVYLVCCFTLSRLVKRLQQRIAIVR
ncbi:MULTISPECIES: amino acid ABC transporter permease [unclassified Acidovorax]|uniref:amino acid ABC transporter permease n=1 Tax=unclassified Acidovorax TaxID=2684926 RepID=UPI001C4828CA|nr:MULTISPECIES: amino acid ABC transporter permease [unclassified Acidovorax]MBV7427362.1 amino acid ABC transporter permease [Acidovorax sp. sif0732]MBV7448486.1 amino acid ABC transporter permease [Acidovorax sp. sif0715]